MKLIMPSEVEIMIRNLIRIFTINLCKIIKIIPIIKIVMSIKISKKSYFMIKAHSNKNKIMEIRERFLTLKKLIKTQ